jgi:hypothetical protein
VGYRNEEATRWEEKRTSIRLAHRQNREDNKWVSPVTKTRIDETDAGIARSLEKSE